MLTIARDTLATFGSLEEDTAVLARHFADIGIGSVAILQEESHIGAAFGSVPNLGVLLKICL